MDVSPKLTTARLLEQRIDQCVQTLLARSLKLTVFAQRPTESQSVSITRLVQSLKLRRGAGLS